KTSEGEVMSKTIFNINVKTSGTITSIVKQAKHGENITISGTYLNWVRRVTFAKNKSVTTFTSVSFDKLVVPVPADAESGPLIITFGGTDTVDIQTVDTLKVLIPQITGMTPNPVDTAANLTITGTNLDLVSSVLFANVTNPVTNFVTQNPTQLVVKVPGAALRGKLVFGIKNSTLTVQSPVDLTLNTLPPLANFTMPFYTDALQNGFDNWSYTDSHDFNSTERVRQGNTAIKAVYAGNGYQGITLHHSGAGISTSGYTKLEFSVYVNAASNGQRLQVITNGNYGGTAPQVTLVGGSWTTFSVPLSDMGNPATISEIVIQGAGFSGTAYIDHIGLR
ncbi:MAG TPA: IPT/TIG domain-containing protein, partial [Flavisolibacter sp.]|nr:IPT/TIG domain-containing protein [Flavisolibacter sp.]